MEEAKDPKKLSSLLKRVAKHPARDVFNMLLLRAMKQATYDTANIGHFGLASTNYLHFTSPIRRYPDLVVHRVVRQILSKKSLDKSPSAIGVLKESATAASERERHAMDVEREVVDLYRALYMRAHIGESFTGKVTALVGSGVFVQIESPFVDVLVKAEDLGGDRYELDDDGLKMVGVRSGDAVALGDAMDVVIEDVAILRRTVYGRRLRAEEPETIVRGKSLPKGRVKKGARATERQVKAHSSHARPGKPQSSRGGKKKGSQRGKPKKKRR
jgi:ribonuclease R